MTQLGIAREYVRARLYRSRGGANLYEVKTKMVLGSEDVEWAIAEMRYDKKRLGRNKILAEALKLRKDKGEYHLWREDGKFEAEEEKSAESQAQKMFPELYEKEAG